MTLRTETITGEPPLRLRARLNGFPRVAGSVNALRIMGNAHILPAEGRFEGITHLFPVRVYFEDTDLSGVVYHANYLRWMERARSDMLALAGIDQRAAFEAGEGAFAVADLHIRYRAPARLGDALTVASRVTRVGAGVAIQQTVSRDTQVLSEAEVVAALVSPSGRARRQPSDWVARFRSLVA